MTLDLLPTVKQAVDIPALLERLFDEHPQGSLAFCPFHENTETPALHIRHDDTRFFCYGCGARGDVIDFVRLAYALRTRQDLGFRGALQLVARLAGIEHDGTPDTLALVAETLRSRPRPRTVAPDALKEWSHNELSHLVLAVRNSGTSGGPGIALWLGEQLDELWARPPSRVEEYQRRVRDLVEVALDHLAIALVARHWVAPEIFLPIPP